MSDMVLLILTLALLTYCTRIGGYVVLARFKRINPRLEAALDAVPAAVITALVAPAVFLNGPPELLAGALAVALSYRLSMIWVVVGGTVAVALLRLVFGA